MKTKTVIGIFRFVVAALTIFAALRLSGVEHIVTAVILVIGWFAIYAIYGGLRPLLFDSRCRREVTSSKPLTSHDRVPLLTGEFVLIMAACLGMGLLLRLI